MKEVHLLTILAIMGFVLSLKTCSVHNYGSCMPQNPTLEQIKACENILK